MEMGALDKQTFTKGMGETWSTRVSIRTPSSACRRAMRALTAPPLELGKDGLTIAIASPADMTTLSELSRLTGTRVMTVLSSADQIRDKLNQYYPEADTWDEGAVAEPAASFGLPSDNAEPIDELLRRVFQEDMPAALTDPVASPSDHILKELLARMISDALPQGELHLSAESGAATRHLTVHFRKGRYSSIDFRNHGPDSRSSSDVACPPGHSGVPQEKHQIGTQSKNREHP